MRSGPIQFALGLALAGSLIAHAGFAGCDDALPKLILGFRATTETTSSDAAAVGKNFVQHIHADPVSVEDLRSSSLAAARQTPLKGVSPPIAKTATVITAHAEPEASANSVGEKYLDPYRFRTYVHELPIKGTPWPLPLRVAADKNGFAVMNQSDPLHIAFFSDGALQKQAAFRFPFLPTRPDLRRVLSTGAWVRDLIKIDDRYHALGTFYRGDSGSSIAGLAPLSAKRNRWDPISYGRPWRGNAPLHAFAPDNKTIFLFPAGRTSLQSHKSSGYTSPGTTYPFHFAFDPEGKPAHLHEVLDHLKKLATEIFVSKESDKVHIALSGRTHFIDYELASKSLLLRNPVPDEAVLDPGLKPREAGIDAGRSALYTAAGPDAQGALHLATTSLLDPAQSRLDKFPVAGVAAAARVLGLEHGKLALVATSDRGIALYDVQKGKELASHLFHSSGEILGIEAGAQGTFVFWEAPRAPHTTQLFHLVVPVAPLVQEDVIAHDGYAPGSVVTSAPAHASGAEEGIEKSVLGFAQNVPTWLAKANGADSWRRLRSEVDEILARATPGKRSLRHWKKALPTVSRGIALADMIRTLSTHADLFEALQSDFPALQADGRALVRRLDQSIASGLEAQSARIASLDSNELSPEERTARTFEVEQRQKQWQSLQHLRGSLGGLNQTLGSAAESHTENIASLRAMVRDLLARIDPAAEAFGLNADEEANFRTIQNFVVQAADAASR